MSWFGDFIGKLFGRKGSQPKAVQSVGEETVISPPKTAGANVAFDEHTLGWLLSCNKPPMPTFNDFDLDNPPAISRDVLETLRRNINQIPPMPEIWHQIQAILQQPDSSASDLGQCVAQDPVLTAQILKVCNSSAYAASGSAEVNNIPLAIARLGLDEASSIIFRSLAPGLAGNDNNRLEIRQIWFESQAIAAISRLLAEPAQTVTRHEVTLIGMLHDIGKLVMLHVEPADKLAKLKAAIDQGRHALTAEFETLGYTHIDAGMMLALHWQLPKHVQQFISYHHHAATMNSEKLPAAMQHSMITLHVAHLILQHIMEKDGDSTYPSIWQQHRRSAGNHTIGFMRTAMLVPLNSTAMLKQIQLDIQRMQATFADLFAPQESSD